MGYLALQGGAEFGGGMRICDLRAIDLAGGFDAQVSIIPAAAAPDDNHRRAGESGCDWFRRLGARNVAALPLIDRSSADDSRIAGVLRHSKLIYLLGGFPGYLAGVLQASQSWRAIMAAMDKGAVVAGSSAGAMVLCEFLYNPTRQTVGKGLGLLPRTCVIPHLNTFGRKWIDRLQKELPMATLIGIDEETGAINDGPHGAWSVYGPGAITLFGNHRKQEYRTGAPFEL